MTSFNSAAYWDARYNAGYSSGDGSYGDLAAFKAEVINHFVAEHKVHTVLEWGCGDGNQLTLAKYPAYLGIDVSPAAVKMCKARFAADQTKRFILPSEFNGERHCLSLSLDVIFHLTEDVVYETYMHNLFQSSKRYIIIYASDTDEQQPGQSPHMRHHEFTRWVHNNARDWQLMGRIPNRYPEHSCADFAMYKRM